LPGTHDSTPISVGNSPEQFGRIDLQNIRKNHDGIQAGGVVSVLDLRDIPASISSLRCELFLRQPTLDPKRFDPFSEQTSCCL
jgi:hypothetical protein